MAPGKKEMIIVLLKNQDVGVAGLAAKFILIKRAMTAGSEGQLTNVSAPCSELRIIKGPK